jgi:hypothetical protein
MAETHFARILAACALMAAPAAFAQQSDPLDQPGELGAVRWWREEAAARSAAAANDKPLLVLFQEVPG